MGELETRKFAGIDLGKTSVQLSIYDEAMTEMTEESFPLHPEEQEDPIAGGIYYVKKYMEVNHLDWGDFQSVHFSMEDTSEANRNHLKEVLDASFFERHSLSVITRLRAFVEYVFHQERVVWDRSTLLMDYDGTRFHYILVEQIRRSKQKAYKASLMEMNLESYGIVEGDPELDYKFSRVMKQFLVKNPAHIIFLTGKGFEGNWMKRTLTYLCAGRRVFLGQNLYANGACLIDTGNISFMDEGMFLMQGPDMVYHTVGLITQESGRAQYVPITSIGREWYNTKGSIDIILDKSQKVEFFYHNTKENEIECATCEIKDLPVRPPKTTRMHIEVQFTSETEGVILLKDMGFGTMFPGTGKVTVFPFKLIS